MIRNALLDLTGKTALITGASSGLGAQFSRCLNAAGARVILAARRIKPLELLANELGNAFPLEMDVTNKQGVFAAVETLTNINERIDICINTAGIAKFSPIFDLEDNAFEEIQKVNVLGVWHVTKAVVNHMKQHEIRGSIINLGSVSGDNVPALNGAGYCSSKAGVHQMTRTLVGELSQYNIRINTLSTWMIPTPMTQAFIQDNQAQIEAMTPLGLGNINDLDAAILFLSSNEASRYMTGSCLTVDGGISCFQQSSLRRVNE